MNPKEYSPSIEAEEHKAYQVVEILKNDIMDEGLSSDSHFSEPVTRQTKTKKSLLTTLIRSDHLKRPKVKITKKIETCSTINFGSTTSEQEFAPCEIASETVESPTSRKSGSCNFFKRIIRPSKNSALKKSAMLNLRKRRCIDSNGCNKNKFFPTTYIPKYSVKLVNGISELQSILHNLSHSEQHIIFLLQKYIEDKTVQDQILERSCEYFALQYDSKRQTNILANKMWLQQVEVSKIQEHNLQERLNFLVKTNRSLEIHNENLRRQCEKLMAKTKLYPRRFLQMKSFRKVHAKQLIGNNRRLQKRVQALTEIISDFEDEMQKLQHQRDVLEEEKRSFRSQVHHLEGAVEKQGNDRELEKAALTLRINHDTNVLKDATTAIQMVFQDLREFEHQLRDFAINVTWPKVQFENACLPEMVYQARACVRELFLTMIATYRNVALVTKEVAKLRNTNARLQENLQKSTNELDNLTKKLEKSSEIDASALEAHCRKLEHENIGLKVKLENVTEQNGLLREEVEIKKRSLSETKTNANDLVVQNRSLCNQIDDLVLVMSQMGKDEISKEFTNQEKLDYLKQRFSQIITDYKQLAERCSTLENENQHVQQIDQDYQQDLHTLQDGITILSAEHDNIKKQLSCAQQTISTLQNERLKYLEEKNILKTIFQHLKSEVSRIQQLEGAVADMSKETSRLSLIAEFNKQLGDQLKSEVDMKEHTILELRQSLEKLSHLQVDNDKEKMTLCAQLSEIATVKDKLSNCLEIELQKNMRLDESKKKLENTTKSQLKIYEEMQKNERAALKELLKDFKSVIKQRDCLVLMEEESKKKCKELEKHYCDLKKQYEVAALQIDKRGEEFKALGEKLHHQEQQHRLQEEKYAATITKCEKSMKKLEKLVGQLRYDKNEVETKNTYLANSLEKVQQELDDAREKASVVDNKISMKVAECATLETELNSYKNQLQVLSQEHGKVLMEVEYLKKLHEQQSIDIKDTISNYFSHDSKYLETQAVIMNKEQIITDLNKILVEREGEIKRLEQECGYLRKQTEDQTKIMFNYENQIVVLQDAETTKLKMREEMTKLRTEHQEAVLELGTVKKENESLKNELKALIAKSENEKLFYHSQANEIIVDYNRQRENIEEEIDSISNQLRTVTDNLQTEKHRFEELAKAHEELKMKHNQMKDSYNSEVAAHKETHRKIESLDKTIKTLTTERNNLQNQVHFLVLEVTEEKDLYQSMVAENTKMQSILAQGKEKFGEMKNKNAALEEELRDLKFKLQAMTSTNDSSQSEIDRILKKLDEKSGELKSAKETIECLKKELSDSQKTLFDLKEEVFKMQQYVTGLEFKNCELTLQLHETQGKLETERNLCKELKALKNPDNSSRAPSECGELFYININPVDF